MAWLSGSLTSPRDAGGPRAGGSRLQMPNWMRVAVPGGEAIAPVGNVSIAIAGGATATIPGGVYATLSGSPALAVTTTHYVTYVTTAAPSVLLACRQQDFAAIYSAADVVGIGWHSDHFDMRLPQGVGTVAPPPGGGSVGHITATGVFDATSMLKSIRLNSGSGKYADGSGFFWDMTTILIPGGAPAVYLLVVTGAGGGATLPLSLVLAAVAGQTILAEITVLARPSNNFDIFYQVHVGPGGSVVTCVPAGLFANAATIAYAGTGRALAPAEYRSTHTVPSDGHGADVTAITTLVNGSVYNYVGVFAADKFSALANSTSYASPLCNLFLDAEGGYFDVAGGGAGDLPPQIQLLGWYGDAVLQVATTNVQVTAQIKRWQYNPGAGSIAPAAGILFGRALAPLAYSSRVHDDADGLLDQGTGNMQWAMGPTAYISREYIAP